VTFPKEAREGLMRAFLKVRLPAAMPQCFVGFKYAGINATVGATIAEFIGSDQGLGFYIQIVTGNMRASPIFEAMGYGALDAVDTPLYGGGAIEERAGPFLAKLASISRLIEDKRALRKVRPHHRPLRPGRRDRLVVFGASADFFGSSLPQP